MDYTNAIDLFKSELLKHEVITQLSNFHKQSPENVVKALLPRITVKSTKEKTVKFIKIDFTDTVSKITVKHLLKF